MLCHGFSAPYDAVSCQDHGCPHGSDMLCSIAQRAHGVSMARVRSVALLGRHCSESLLCTLNCFTRCMLCSSAQLNSNSRENWFGVTCFPRLPVTGDPRRVTCHRLCFVMVSRHLVMLAMQSFDMLYYVLCFPKHPVTSDSKRVMNVCISAAPILCLHFFLTRIKARHSVCHIMSRSRMSPWLWHAL